MSEFTLEDALIPKTARDRELPFNVYTKAKRTRLSALELLAYRRGYRKAPRASTRISARDLRRNQNELEPLTRDLADSLLKRHSTGWLSSDASAFAEYMRGLTVEIQRTGNFRLLPDMNHKTFSVISTWLDWCSEFSVVSYRGLATPTDESHRDLACNTSVPEQTRAMAIAKWLEDDCDEASQFILQELITSTDVKWQAWLVSLSEDTWFDIPADRESLVEILFRIAHERCSIGQPADEIVAKIAIRRAGLLLPANDLDRLVEFTRFGNVHLTSVVLGVVRSVLEVEPTNTKLQLCLSRVHQLAITYSNPDVYSRGQIDAMLFDSLVVLALLEDPELEDVLARLSALQRPFLFGHLKDKLADIDSKAREVMESDGRKEVKSALAQIDRVVAKTK